MLALNVLMRAGLVATVGDRQQVSTISCCYRLPQTSTNYKREQLKQEGSVEVVCPVALLLIHVILEVCFSGFQRRAHGENLNRGRHERFAELPKSLGARRSGIH